MRYFLVVGGFAGFAVAFGGSLHAGNAPAYALRDGAVGCLVGALLMRAMHAVYFASLRSLLTARAEAMKARLETPTN